MKRRKAPKRKPSPRYYRRPRSQRVRFRKRVAASVVTRLFRSTWTVLRVGALTGLAVWATLASIRLIRTNPYFRIQAVVFEGPNPVGLAEVVDLRAGDSLLAVQAGRREDAALAAYPELSDVDIDRRLDRSIVVRTAYRDPLFIWEDEKGVRRGVSAAGVLFPLRPGMKDPVSVAVLSGALDEADRRRVASSLAAISTEMPALYGRFNDIKTDTISGMTVTLLDGVVVHWGPFNPETALAKSRDVLSVLERFSPTSTEASMRFLEQGRVVLDRHWKKIDRG